MRGKAIKIYLNGDYTTHLQAIYLNLLIGFLLCINHKHQIKILGS